MLFLFRTLFSKFYTHYPKICLSVCDKSKQMGKKDTDSAVSFRLLIYQFILLFFFNLWKFWLNSCYHQPHIHVTQTLSNFPWKFKSHKAQVRFGMKCTIIWQPVPRILINGNIWANDVPITQKSPSLVTKFFFSNMYLCDLIWVLRGWRWRNTCHSNTSHKSFPWLMIGWLQIERVKSR